jgi:AcrR family transcriptional regulator
MNPAMVEPRTRQSRGNDTRSRLVQAGRAVLVDVGPTAFSMRAVALHAGVSLSNLQFHYGHVAALLDAVLNEELLRGQAMVAEAMAVEDERPMVARAIDALLVQQHDEASMKLYLSMWSIAAYQGALRTSLSAFYDRFVDDVVTAMGASEIENRRPRARVAVALLEGASLFRSGVAGGLSAGDEEVLRSVLLGLLGVAAPSLSAPSPSPSVEGEL